jgi:excisionase family DNA binding protein
MSTESKRRRRKPPRQPGAPLTVAEAAVALSLGERTVRQLCTLGRLGHYRDGAKGGVIRIPEHAVASYQARLMGREEEDRKPESVRVGRKHLGRKAR